MAAFSKVFETLKSLPVAGAAPHVVQSLQQNNVTVLAAPTGSGKSMLVPAMLADATDEQVVVLVPRRFLATDAAKNVAAMAHTELGNEVGFAIGQMAGEQSRFSDKTKLLFVTYGYAISSGLINTAKHIVLDEVHEAAEDISLARAILHERKKADPDLRLLEMSATVNAADQAGYWEGVARTAVHQVKGSTLSYDERQQNPGDDRTIAQTAGDLIEKEDRKGIAVFCPGIKEVERTAEELEAEFQRRGIKQVEVVTITGSSDEDERNQARLPPKPGWRKVIVGTNVIESGVNLRWVDSGISDGYGKIPYDRPDTGAEALMLEDLPQWRIVQQRGRINRDPAYTGFDKGIFILHANKTMDARAQQTTPELERRSLTRIAFHAAALGYQPETLHFDANIPPARWNEAKEDLIRLGLVKEDWTLTKDGEYVSRLPLSPETGAMLCEARRIDIAAIRSGDAALRARSKLLPDAIIVAALIEQGGIREDYRRPHRKDGNSDVHGGSDVIDSMKAYLELAKKPQAETLSHTAEIIASNDPKRLQELQYAREDLQIYCTDKKLNVNYTSFRDTLMLVNQIKSRVKDQKEVRSLPHAFDQQRYNDLKQVIMHGSVHRLFELQPITDEQHITYRDLWRDYGGRKNLKGDPYSGYEVNRFSILKGAQQTSLTPLVVGTLRELPARKGDDPETILDQVTSVPTDVFLRWAADHHPQLLDNMRKEDQTLTARYAGRATFSLPVDKKTSKLLEQENIDSWADSVKQGNGGYHRR